MIQYLLNVVMSNRKLPISTDLEKAIMIACKNASQTTNAKRSGKTFDYVRRINEFAVQIKVTSDTPIDNPTRAISSITRALLRTYEQKNELISATYCGSILNASIEQEISDNDIRVKKLEPNEIMEEVFKLFYSQSKMTAPQRKRAKVATAKITGIVMDYLNNRDASD